MKYLIILIIIILCNFGLVGQEHYETIERPKNNISAGFMGDVSFYSFTYERYRLLRPDLILNSKIGLGYNFDLKFCFFSNECIEYDYLTLPIHVTANFGREKYFLECGLGSTFVYNTIESYLFIYPILGVRFIPLRSKRISFRVFGQMPIPIGRKNYIFALPLGVNLGFSF